MHGVCVPDEVFWSVFVLYRVGGWNDGGRGEHVGWCRNCQMPGIGVVAVVAVVAVLAVFCGCWGT